MSWRVFVSYSHDDRAWRDAFRQMLGLALDRHGVQFWADSHFRSGDRWERVIGDALDSADLGLLLVTLAYLESSFSWHVEVPALLAHQVPVVWVLVEECLWDYVKTLTRIQELQDPARTARWLIIPARSGSWHGCAAKSSTTTSTIFETPVCRRCHVQVVAACWRSRKRLAGS